MKQIRLNPAQQKAVDHIYGPLLVLAGPGTGKTQLLSARIANILTHTDANPSNILCLTFTENAAQNMRERLASIIGAGAYDVHIATYHSFGSDIIRSYPEFFESIDLETGKDSRIERPIDDLQRIQILTEIIGKLPFSSPLIGSRHYIKDVSSTISELKRGLYTPDKLRSLAEDNLALVKKLSPVIADHLSDVKRFPSKADTSIELFGPIFELLGEHSGLAELAQDELGKAMLEAQDTNKSTPLTAWKNDWLHKDVSDKFMFTDEPQHLRMLELAKVYESYQSALESRQLYDFDDMILRTIDALITQDELRFNLQEKYQFILLDEFQDTNAAQFELVKHMADNPVNEGQPNVFAVGDDDQAIYAFQGAKVSNMLAFKESFRDVTVVNLTENYRSHPDILHIAHGIAGQIESRLHHELENVEKTLTASSQNLPKDSTVERHEFSAVANEYSWVASKISELIASGTKPSEIAVLAPRHKHLESIVPFMASHRLPMAYEKRENILESSEIRMFRLMSELVLACHANDDIAMSELLPQVLSFDFYQIPVAEIWSVNWQYRRGGGEGWAELAMQNDTLAPHVLFYLTLGLRVSQEPLEYLLDYLSGSTPVHFDSESSYTSPYRSYYFGDPSRAPLVFYESLANLTTIREHLRAWQQSQDSLLELADFIRFIKAYEVAEQPLINSHPVALADDSVQLMTIYKAKGLEFEHVFMLSVHDDIWGKSARSNSSKLSLPANLQHVRYQGSSEDELRRLLFVAITRAKHGLYLTSHAHRDNGKATEPVKYLLEYTDGDVRKTTVLPEHAQAVRKTEFTESETMQAIDTMWHSRHVQLTADLKSLLKERLQNYRMSPTHLNTFIGLDYGGPEAFLLSCLLKFPQAPREDGEYGNAIHRTLERHQERIARGESATIDQALADFDRDLAKRYIPADRMDDFRARGHYALKAYISARADMFARTAKPEVDFRKEGVLVGDAQLLGKIDRLEVDQATKTLHVVDFKTGKAYTKWEKDIKLLKYRQQLYFYKLLLEGSHTWKSYTVGSARLEFVEPDPTGKVVDALEIKFDTIEYQGFIKLINVVWSKIQSLDLPDVSDYSDDYAGVQAFIAKLTEGA